MEATMDDHAQGKSKPAKPAAGTARAPYVRPVLKVYGDIAALTQTIGKTSKKADGGSGQHSKTA